MRFLVGMLMFFPLLGFYGWCCTVGCPWGGLAGLVLYVMLDNAWGAAMARARRSREVDVIRDGMLQAYVASRRAR